MATAITLLRRAVGRHLNGFYVTIRGGRNKWKSTIGNGLTITGQGARIISKGRLEIDGKIFGDIIGSDLTNSADGSVFFGTVSAERVNVFGRVKGEIRARAIILHPTAQVEADILHRTLEVAEGAHFEGRVSRVRDVADVRPILELAQ
jgi:cytoskeletal protein CcmA (bactofilin family)